MQKAAKFHPVCITGIKGEMVMVCSNFFLKVLQSIGNAKGKIAKSNKYLTFPSLRIVFSELAKKFLSQNIKIQCFTQYNYYVTLILTLGHGCVKSTAIERMQHQLGRMADFPPPVTFSVFDL